MQKIDMVLNQMDIDKSDQCDQKDPPKQIEDQKGEDVYGFPIDTLATPLTLQPKKPQQLQQPSKKGEFNLQQPSKKGEFNAYGFEIEPLCGTLAHPPKRLQQPCNAIVICDDDDADEVVPLEDDDDTDDIIIGSALSYVPPDVEGKVTKKKSTPKDIKKDTASTKGKTTSTSTVKKVTVKKVSFICFVNCVMLYLISMKTH